MKALIGDGMILGGMTSATAGVYLSWGLPVALMVGGVMLVGLGVLAIRG